MNPEENFVEASLSSMFTIVFVSMIVTCTSCSGAIAITMSLTWPASHLRSCLRRA